MVEREREREKEKKKMLVREEQVDSITRYGKNPLHIFIWTPFIENYPRVQFPGIILFSEIYQVTETVRRLAKRIASNGYIVISPSLFHNFVGSEPLPFNNQGQEDGNDYKIQKPLDSYDEDIDICCKKLYEMANFDGRGIGATGMCLGGHLAFRSLLNESVCCATCFSPTDIDSKTLGFGMNDNTLSRVIKEVEPSKELLLIFGTESTKIGFKGRDLIRDNLRSNGINFSILELMDTDTNFISDERDNDKFNPTLSECCFSLMFEQFNRRLKTSLGCYTTTNEEK